MQNLNRLRIQSENLNGQPYEPSFQTKSPTQNMLDNNIILEQPLNCKAYKEEDLLSPNDENEDLSEYSSTTEDSQQAGLLSRTLTPPFFVSAMRIVPYNTNTHDNPFSRPRPSYEINHKQKSSLREEDIRLSYSPTRMPKAKDDSSLLTQASISTALPVTLNKLQQNSAQKFLECMKNARALENLLSFLELSDIMNISRLTLQIKSDRSIQKTLKKTAKLQIIQGIKLNEQVDFWKSILPFKQIKEQNACKFINMALRESKYHREISKDVDRTLQTSSYFQEQQGRMALYRVLIAISNSENDVGYIQGLNSVVGTFLLYLKEEDAYWMTVYLLRKKSMNSLYCPPFIKSELWIYQLDILMQNYLPDIHAHITKGGLTVRYFSTPWFLSLYTHYLPTTTVIKIWNLFLMLGEKIFIQIALAINVYYKEQFLSRDVDDIGDFFKERLQEISADEELIQLALKFKITKHLLSQIESYYNSEDRPISLVLEVDIHNPSKKCFYRSQAHYQEELTHTQEKTKNLENSDSLIKSQEDMKEELKEDLKADVKDLNSEQVCFEGIQINDLLVQYEGKQLQESTIQNTPNARRSLLAALFIEKKIAPNSDCKSLDAFVAQRNSANHIEPQQRKGSLYDSQTLEGGSQNGRLKNIGKVQNRSAITKNFTISNIPPLIQIKKIETLELSDKQEKLELEDSGNQAPLINDKPELILSTDGEQLNCKSSEMEHFGMNESKSEESRWTAHTRKRSNSFSNAGTSSYSIFKRERLLSDQMSPEGDTPYALKERLVIVEKAPIDSQIDQTLHLK